MSNLIQQIQNKLNSDFIENAFPVLLHQGVKDEHVYVHSIGCSLWNTLGHEFDYMAVVEGPAPSAAGNDIRSDSIWFDKKTVTPKVLIEYERFDGTYKGKRKLLEKLINLIDAAARWQSSTELLVLSFWSQDLVSLPDFNELEQVFQNGALNNKGAFLQVPNNCQLLINRMMFIKGSDGLLRLKNMTYRCIK